MTHPDHTPAPPARTPREQHEPLPGMGAARRLRAVPDTPTGTPVGTGYGPVVQHEHGPAAPVPTLPAGHVPAGQGTAVAEGADAAGQGDVTGPVLDYSNPAVHPRTATDSPTSPRGVVGPAVVESSTPGAPLAPSSGYSREVSELERLGAAQVARARAWLPVVDQAVFGCYLGRLALTIDPHTEGDPVGVLASLVGAAGVHLGPGPHLRLGFGERHPLLVWPMLVGATGIGRKGTATNAALGLLGLADPHFLANNKRSGLSSGEGLAAAFAVTDDDGNGGGGSPRLLPEGDFRLLAVETEWGGVMARMKREGNTLGALLRQAWEGGDLSTLNVAARMAHQSHLGIIAHITPKEFRGKVSAADLAGGTYNRFLPVAVAQSKSHPPTPDDVLMNELAASLAARLDHAATLTVIGFTPAAELAYRRLQIEFDAHLGGDGPVEEFISRAAANCVRIAAIHAALDRTPLITLDHLEAAAALVRYSIATAQTIVGQGPEAAQLRKLIGDAGPQGCDKTAITRRFHKDKRTTDRYTAALRDLIEKGDVTVTRLPRADGRPGKGKEVYILTRP